MPKGKTARNRISSSHLFLMELILALLLFSVASAASVSVFVRAHKMSRQATELGRAADAASSLIELIRSSRSVEEMRGRITEEYPGAEISADLIEMDLSVPFDAGTSSGTMTAEIRSVDQCIEGTVRCYVNEDASGEPAVELPFSHYLNEA